MLAGGDPPSRRRRLLAAGFAFTTIAAGCLHASAAVAKADGSAALVHVVRPGDWLFAIGRTYEVSPDAIARLNGLSAPYQLREGQRLLIPVATAPVAGRSPAQVKLAASGPATLGAQGARPASPTIQPPAVAPAASPNTPQTAGPAVTVEGQPVSPASAPPPAAGEAIRTAPARPARLFTIMLGLRDGQRYLGDVESTVAPNGDVTVNSAQALDLLKPLLSKPNFDKLAQALGGPGQVPLATFASGGAPASYDPGQLQVVVQIPAAARPSESLNVADLDRELVGQVVRPLPVSGYVNFRGAFDYVEKGGDTGFNAPDLLIDGAFRIHGLVFETEAQIQPDNTGSAFTRQGSRIVYDDTRHTVRYTVGDLEVQTSGFQGGPAMAGVSILRLYDELAPQLNVRPRGNRSFTLEHASTVETLVNGRSVQRVRLDPGTYNLSNFPFVQGANDVRLIIEDDAGVRQSIDFSIFFDRTLLRPGLSEFGAFAGVPTGLDNGDISYNSNEPTFTGFYRHGFSDRLTAGGNLQADTHTQMGGIEGVWGSVLGTLGFDLAASHNDRAGAGYALNVGLTRLKQDPATFKSETLAATFEVRSDRFTTLGDVIAADTSGSGLANNPYRFEAALSYGRAFNEYTFATIDGRYALARHGQPDVASLRGTVGYRLTETADVTFDVQYAKGGFEDGVSFGIQFTKRFGRTTNLRAEYDSGTDTARLSYDTSHGRGMGSWTASGSLERNGDAVGFNGSATYDANRAEIGVAHVATYNTDIHSLADQRTSFRLGTSIAFGGGSFGLGRPIYDSFALFTPHQTLHGAPVLVDPSPDGALAKSGSLGAGVLNDLGSYSLRTVLYDVPTAPPGYDIGQGTVRVFPPYRSGYRVQVGSDYSILVIGKLLQSDGTPVPLLAGKAIELDRKGGKTVILFTSRDGRFGAQGLAPGHWRIEMPTQPTTTTYDLVIPQNAESLIKVGDLHPSGEK